MSLLKNTMLAMLLAVATPAMAQEQWTRVQYIQKCEESGAKAGKDKLEVDSVCNCAGQFVSYVGTNGRTEWADYTIDVTNDILIKAVQYCRAAYTQDPQAFMKKFGTLSVSNGEKEAL